MHRLLEGEMKNIIVSRTKSGRTFVSIQVEVELAEPVLVGDAVGVDLGLRDFATLSTGEKYAPSHCYRKAQLKRRHIARQLSRKKPGSRNREKARLRLARLDERIANQENGRACRDQAAHIGQQSQLLTSTICPQTCGTQVLAIGMARLR